MSARDFCAKLLAALHHPLAEVRLRAIISLGRCGESKAAQPLAQCALRHPTDVSEGLQVVESLGAIRNPAARRRALHVLAMAQLARAPCGRQRDSPCTKRERQRPLSRCVCGGGVGQDARFRSAHEASPRARGSLQGRKVDL